MLIDARGQGCPKPVMLAEEALAKIGEGIVEVLVDNEDSALNVSGFAVQNGMFAETRKEGGDFKVRIVKGYTCETGLESAEPAAAKKSLLLVVGTHVMGREEELGKTLLKAFFETMKVYKQVPHTIFLLNTGVNLATIDADIVGLLKDIEKRGVEIYSCGTGLTKYSLEAE